MSDRPDIPEHFNEGIKVLITRMRENPEDFNVGDGELVRGGSWDSMLHMALREGYVTTDEEHEFVTQERRILLRDAYTVRVMNTLMKPQDDGVALNNMSHTRVSTAQNGVNLVGTGGASGWTDYRTKLEIQQRQEYAEKQRHMQEVLQRRQAEEMRNANLLSGFTEYVKGVFK